MNKIIKYKEIYKILSKKEKKFACLAIIISTISAFFDVLGISSILPLLSILINPEIITNNKYLILFNSKFDLSNDEFIILAALISFIIFFINQLFRLFSSWFILYLSENILFEKSKILFFYYLVRPYKLFLKSNTSHLVQKCTNYVNSVVAGYFTPMLVIISQFFTLLFIVLFLLFYQPILTLILSVVLFVFYFLFYLKLKKRIITLGSATPSFYKNSSKIITDTFETFKEFKLSQNKNFFMNGFQKTAKKYKDANILINLYQQFPAFVIEVFSYLIILLLTMYLYFFLDSFYKIIPLIGIIALSLRRLIPAAQVIYTQVSQINFYQKSFEKIIEDLKKAINYNNNIPNTNSKFFYKKKIEFKNIHFKYDKKIILKNINLSIDKGSFVGVTGLSGQGKTTFLDILSGLLEPYMGMIKLDNKKFKALDNQKWQNLLSHVPQKGYLMNNSIIRNICYDSKKVDIKKIKKICEIVEIKNFIEKDLPNKYKTILGENGYRISGGQAQRIILARSLYSNPEILILDEATNSIDNLTEKRIIKNIKTNYKNLTIIFVSHRINILSFADKILFFNKNTLEFSEKFIKLKKKSKKFRDLITIENNNNQLIEKNN